MTAPPKLDEARLRDSPKLTVELVRHYGTMNMRKWSGGGDFEPGTHVMIPLCLAETILANALSAERERVADMQRRLELWEPKPTSGSSIAVSSRIGGNNAPLATQKAEGAET